MSPWHRLFVGEAARTWAERRTSHSRASCVVRCLPSFAVEHEILSHSQHIFSLLTNVLLLLHNLLCVLEPRRYAQAHLDQLHPALKHSKSHTQAQSSHQSSKARASSSSSPIPKRSPRRPMRATPSRAPNSKSASFSGRRRRQEQGASRAHSSGSAGWGSPAPSYLRPVRGPLSQAPRSQCLLCFFVVTFRLLFRLLLALSGERSPGSWLNFRLASGFARIPSALHFVPQLSAQRRAAEGRWTVPEECASAALARPLAASNVFSRVVVEDARAVEFWK